MAVSPCGFDQILVSGSTDTDANGVYIWEAVEDPLMVGQFRNPAGYNIYKITSGEFTGQWYINYGFPRFLSTVTPDCPAGITFAQWTNPYGAPGAPPTSITQYPAPAPDPYAPWGGFANWQRLRLLEYV